MADQHSSGTGGTTAGPRRRRSGRSPALLAALVALPVAALAGLLAFWGMGGFDAVAPSPSASVTPGGPQPTTPVSMPARPLGDRAALACRGFIAELPGQVRGLVRRPVTGGAEQNAAYGEPPITVSCGSAPASVAPTDTVYVLDKVCWYAASQDDGVVWTTVDREFPVRVRIPSTYQPPGQWVIDFSGPVISSIPSRAEKPTGCTG